MSPENFFRDEDATREGKKKKRERQDVSSFSLGLKLIGPGLEKYYQNTHTHTISTKPSTGLVAMAIMLCNSAYRKGGGV